jgi:hypothetical protein
MNIRTMGTSTSLKITFCISILSVHFEKAFVL